MPSCTSCISASRNRHARRRRIRWRCRRPPAGHRGSTAGVDALTQMIHRPARAGSPPFMAILAAALWARAHGFILVLVEARSVISVTHCIRRPGPIGAVRRHRVQQRLRYSGCCGFAKTLSVAPSSTISPATHHQDARAQITHHRKIVADEHHGQARRRLRSSRQLRICACTDTSRPERSRRRPRDRLGAERASDIHALALAARQLRRESGRGNPAAGRYREAMLPPPAAARSPACSCRPTLQRLRQKPHDAAARVERRLRVLENRAGCRAGSDARRSRSCTRCR